jgi:hypothetical protein
LKVEQVGPKQWSLVKGEDVITLELTASPITNKFFIISKFLENVSNHCGEEFDEWLFDLINKAKDPEIRPRLLIDNIDKLKDFSDRYIDSCQIDFSQFVDEKKAKKNSILFMPDEIEKIIRLSCYLKIYSLFSNSEHYRLGQRVHREIYNKMALDAIKSDVVRKIYDVIKTKTYRYNLTDKFMWEYIKNVQGKDIGSHIIEIFNFIMNSILVLCEEDKNPITYFVGVIDESVKWFLRSVYKDSIVYDDTVATEDIQGINIDNLKTYSYNDTLGRLEVIALANIYKEYEKSYILDVDSSATADEKLIEFEERISNIDFISPLCETLTFPIISKITAIPYNHLKTLTPEHAAIISVYVQGLFEKVFPNEYKETVELMSFFPIKSPSVSTTYQIKLVHNYLSFQNDEMQNFFGFKNKIFPHDALCHFVGRIARVSLVNIIDGSRRAGIPLSKVEHQMMQFFTLFFAGRLERKFEKMTALMNADF